MSLVRSVILICACCLLSMSLRADDDPPPWLADSGALPGRALVVQTGLTLDPDLALAGHAEFAPELPQYTVPESWPPVYEEPDSMETSTPVYVYENSYNSTYYQAHQHSDEGWLRRHCLNECSPWARLLPFAFVPSSRGIGIGHERVMLAPIHIEPAQPFSHTSLQFFQGWNLGQPDRSEFFWAAPPRGPAADRSVDVTTFTARMETATARASAIFAVPIRSVNPELGPNTSGVGDLVVGGKLMLVDGKNWSITQQTLTHISTGSYKRGMGTGHVAMEPGLLARYRFTNTAYLHSQLRYVIPLSGTGNAAGQVLIWGLGASWICHETDAFAILPTLEMVGHSFMDGQRTTASGTTVDVDGETAVQFLPGVRFVLGPKGDLGLPEIGISGGVTVGDSGWYTGQFLLETRWSF